MTSDRQRQLLAEIVAEYDLETVLDALLEIHDPREVAAAVPMPVDSWEVISGKALCDELIAACQQSDS